jgi:hypothetical protein
MNFKKSLFLGIFLSAVFLMVNNGPLYAQIDNRLPFKHRVGNPGPDNNLFRIRGDFAIIGNTNLTLSEYEVEKDNSLNQMAYVDIDQDTTTTNSSSATLVFSQENDADASCSDILYAGLYWSGRAQQGLGLIFEVNTGNFPGQPQEINAEVQQLAGNDSIHYSSYFYYSNYLFDDDGLLFPQYVLYSNIGLGEILFNFENGGADRLKYSIEGEIMKPVTNLQITTSGNVTIATFDPISFSENGVIFTIDKLIRTSGTNGMNYFPEDNSMQITASGTYIPQVPKIVKFDKRKVKLKGPAASKYTEITATGNNILFPFEELREMYVGYADVTDYVKANGMGEYTLADLALTEGFGDNSGTYGHWGLVVVYQNPKMHWRDVTIFDGYSFVQSLSMEEATGEIEINGLGTVQDGKVDMKLGVMAGEGDRTIEGDFMEIINQEGEWTRLHHPLNTIENFFNSSIYTPVRNMDGTLFENPRNPNLLNNTGIDIAMWDIPNPDNSIIRNGQSSIRFRFGTKQDLYNIYALAFSVRSYLPVIQALNKIESIDGEAPGENPTVKPGQEITLSLEIRNLGEEATKDTRVVIPIPFNASFVSAQTIPVGYGTLSFDPDLGLAGSIIWDMGEVPLPSNPDEIIATLEYTLKITDDCLILANSFCEASVIINGSVSGIGSNSQSVFSNIPFIQGMEKDDCEGREIPGPVEVPIVGVMEFVELNCNDFELISGLGPIVLPDFCQGEPPVDLISLIFPSQQGFTVYFFSEEKSDAPLFNYNVNTSIPGTETVWVTEGPSSSCTGIRVPVILNVLPRTPVPMVYDIRTCSSDGLLEFGIYPNEDYKLIYYANNNPLSTPLDTIPKVDLSRPGNYSVWVSNFKEGECESRRREVKMEVPDCSLYPEITVNITPDIYAYSYLGELVTYTIELVNTGLLPLSDVYLMESLTQASWNIPLMEPGEKLVFVVTYAITNEDLAGGRVYNYTYTQGFSNIAGTLVASEDDVNIYVLPDGFLDYEVIAIDENCETNGDSFGTIELKFLNESQSGRYLLIREEDGREFSGYFENAKSFIVEVPSGIYSLTIFDTQDYEHRVPGSFEIKKRESVDFSLPSNVTACSIYSFVPESALVLEYRLIGPDGATIFPNGDNSFELNKSGMYTIRGIDPSGERCPVEKTFQATIKQPSNIEFDVLPFCSEEAFTTVKLRQDSQDLSIRWFKVESGEDVPILWADDNDMLFVENEGEYSVTLTDSEGCVIGKGRIQVSRSSINPPLLNQLYSICSSKKVGVTLEVGIDFAEAIWYKNEIALSNSLVFSAESAGVYTLEAKDKFGCEHIVHFEVEDKCMSTMRYPNSIVPNDPNRAFVIYPDNLVDWMEVLIQNRWGELIYFCEDSNPRSGKPSTCIWDGMVNNIKVINGSYMLQIRYRTKGQGETVLERGVILVMD